MGRCTHVIQCLTICCLFLSLSVAEFRLRTCDKDARLEALALFYQGRISEPYTCDDMQGIQHGKGCRKKCKAVTNVLNSFGCNPSLMYPVCFKRHSRKRREIDSECDTQTNFCTSGYEYEYRHIDGSCNNLRNPLWGKSDRIQNRLLPNVYDDGRDSPRSMGCSDKLPNPRKISNILHKADDDILFDNRLSYMMMQVGQFLAHDVVLTKLFERSDGEPLECCGADSDNRECFPIEIPDDDPRFKPGACMNFGRSQARRDCNDVRGQVNSQTSYIDLSVVYGANDREARLLRTLQGGLLKTIDNKLPADVTDETCELSKPQDIPFYYCTLAGDERSDEQPGLSSIHTLFVREHNRLAEGLARVNPHWDDERLYQEARKINIAQWQNIVYTEYIPLVIGKNFMRRYDLGVRRYGYKDTYNPRVDATITNSFAVATLRYGHSLIHKNISLLGNDKLEKIEPLPLDHEFFEPEIYHSHGSNTPDYILFWTSTTKCPFRDRKVEESVRDKLFLDAKNDSLDLAAVNIQRARDHGIPGYNAFRRLCHLSEVTHFGTGPGGLVDHDPYEAELISQVYSCPDDIDLYPGFLTERNSPGSILGPTAQCLMAMEMKRLRDGDRFFFERRDFRTPWIGFSPAQLSEIKRIRLSTVFCLNTSIESLQRNVFLNPHYGSRYPWSNLVPCNIRRGVNLTLWRDRF